MPSSSKNGMRSSFAKAFEAGGQIVSAKPETSERCWLADIKIATISAPSAIHEVNLMRFRLTYTGELRASQPRQEGVDRPSLAKHKHELRKVFHEQLKIYWSQSNFLANYKVDRDTLPELTRPIFNRGWDMGSFVPNDVLLSEYLAEQYARHGFRFAPLVRKEISLTCELHILLLREDDMGGALQAGDLDNRVKTLVDGLKMPRQVNELGGHKCQEDEDPFYCLLEDDSLVTALNVETDTLLIKRIPDVDLQSDGKFVSSIISVLIRPTEITHFNLAFL